jgi:hypothetical protein
MGGVRRPSPLALARAGGEDRSPFPAVGYSGPTLPNPPSAPLAGPGMQDDPAPASIKVSNKWVKGILTTASWNILHTVVSRRDFSSVSQEYHAQGIDR